MWRINNFTGCFHTRRRANRLDGQIVWDGQVDWCRNGTNTSSDKQVVWIIFPSIWRCGETIFLGRLYRLDGQVVWNRPKFALDEQNGRILTTKESGTDKTSVVLWVIKITHFPWKEWKPGARVGSRSMMRNDAIVWGGGGGRTCICFQTRAPPNDPITERAPTLAQFFTLFESGLWRRWLARNLQGNQAGGSQYRFQALCVQIFCLSVFIWIQDGQNKMTCPSSFYTRWKNRPSFVV